MAKNSGMTFWVLVAGVGLGYAYFGDGGTDRSSSRMQDLPEAPIEWSLDDEAIADSTPVPSSPLVDLPSTDFLTDLPPSTGGSYPSYRSDYPYLLGDDEEDEDRPEFDEYAAKRAAEREMQLRGYDYRYGCTIDCSGHEAGWQYRADTGYDTYGNSYGYGNSQSFGEGALAYEEAVRDRVEEMRTDHELGIDDYSF